MIITISGTPGAGKGTIGKLLAKKLKYKYYSMGDLRGKMALERGMTIDELNKLGEKESFTDKDVDDYQRKLGQTEDNIIVDGRLSWFCIPTSVKIFVKCERTVGAERIFKAPRRPDEPQYESVDDVFARVNERIASDTKRYKKYYGVDYLDEKNYDFIINTTTLTPEASLDKVLDFLKARGVKA